MKLALIFPGVGYHTDKPLLYYSRKIAAGLGFEIMPVPYGGFEKGIKGSAQKMEETFYSALRQAEEILKDVNYENYKELLFISKSVGTVVAAAYAQKHGLSTQNIYYTPVEATFRFEVRPGIVFHGTKDGWVETDLIRRECAKRQFPLHIVEGANHSLEVGDAAADIQILAQVMEETERYLKSVLLQ